MFKISVHNDKQTQQLVHEAGPLELGRGLARDLPRIQVDDEYISRDQLRVEALTNDRIRLENLSQKNAIRIVPNGCLEVGKAQELALPVQLSIGRTQIHIGAATSNPSQTAVTLKRPVSSLAGTLHDPGAPDIDEDSLVLLDAPVRADSASLRRRPLHDGQAPTVEALSQWLETIITLQQSAPGSPEFTRHVAQTLVDLIGLDMGLVLFRRDEGWAIVGSFAVDSNVRMNYSQTLLRRVLASRQTMYQDLKEAALDAVSLDDTEAVVAAPVFGLNQDVVGVLYGMRSKRTVERGGILPLEAKLVQLLSEAVGANLARSTATRTRVQFEQFFSPELVRELERDPSMLAGRNQELTILASDLRGFTGLSQRLGAESTCALMRALMDRLSELIVEQGGVIVDYAGDGILAMWNAPLPQADHPARACRAALAMLDAMPGFNAQWQDQVGHALALGVAVNTGAAQVGNTGSIRKLKYGPHGHTVNLTNRVQDATKQLGLPLLITAATRNRLDGSFAARRLGQFRLRDVEESVTLFELAGARAAAHWPDYRDVYETALTQFESSQWGKACHTLMPLLEAAAQCGQYDRPTLKLMRRSWECLEVSPNPFTPIIEVVGK